jgi:predicted outer membrane repeat protein
LSVTGSSFTGNIAFYSGGAIYNDGSESVLTGCSFTGNTAFSTGGGIYNTRTLTVTDSIFTDNTATTGGAIYNLVRLTANFNRIVGNYPTAIHNLGLFVDA